MGFSSRHSIAAHNGALIATLQRSRLLISSSLTNEVIQTIQLPQDFVTRCRFFQWFGPYEAPSNTFREQESGKLNLPAGRILLADNDAVRIYDVADSKWQAVIDKAAGSSGRIADVSFGHTEDEVLVFSDFGVKLTIWSLITRRAVEIRDPKYMVHCHGYRPWTGHLAILTRPAAQDILMLLNPKTYELVRSAELPTIDCQEISWSPDGNWIAIRDVASAGYKVLIYTADGHLYKFCYSKNILSDISLGVKEMQWSPSGGVLAIGDNNDHVELFSKDTFSPFVDFYHPATITLPDTTIWEEQINASKERNYVPAPQPAIPPTSLGQTNYPTHGISIIRFNCDGTLLATTNDFIPTTIWIWSLVTNTVATVLIHHSPVKNAAWHPLQPDLLLIPCAIPETAVHLWKATWEAPRIVQSSLNSTGGRLEASWLRNTSDDVFNLMLSSTHEYLTALLQENGEILPNPFRAEGVQSVGVGAEILFDEGNSLDLSPIKISHEMMGVDESWPNENDHSRSSFGFGEGVLDDTFQYHKHAKLAS